MAKINVPPTLVGDKPTYSQNVFTSIMGPVAREVLGKPTKETAHELRFRTRGSMAIDLDKGIYFDHEADHGGGVIDFLHSELGLEKSDALAWLESRGFIEAQEQTPPLAPVVLRLVTRYDYLNQDETLRFQVERYEPKTFRQRRPDGNGGWIPSTKDIELCLYRLPQVMETMRRGNTVYVVEGEKAADHLSALGFCATCSPGGANKWQDEYTPFLIGADVVVLPDNDPQTQHSDGRLKFHADGRPVLPGQDHAADVARRLQGIAKRVRKLDLPGLPLKGDVADWIEAGGTKWGFRELVREARDYDGHQLPPSSRAQPVVTAVKVSPALPDGLLDVDGALGEFIAYCQATAISPQPFLALAAGVVAIGALAGRRYRTETNLRTNLYAVGIAASGGGKDHARKRIKTVFAAAGLTRFLGGEDIASGAGMITALQRHPAMLFQIDEFGDWLEGVLGKQAGTHKKQIAQKLKELFSNADTFVTGVERANQNKDKGTPREDIIQPHACMYGTTTPKQFWDAIAGGSLEDGFLARFLICVSPDNFPDEQEPEQIDPPESLIKAFQAIAGGTDDLSGNLASAIASGLPMSAQAEAYPYLAPFDPAAKAAIRAIRKEQLAWRKRAKQAHVEATVARWAEHTTKLALLHAVSRDPIRPVITERDVVWGRTFALHCIDTMLEQAGHNVADNDYERRLNKCMDIVRRHGQPITERDLIRKGLKLPTKDRAEVLKTLMDAGRLMAAEKEMSGPGRRTVLYAIVNDEENDD